MFLFTDYSGEYPRNLGYSMLASFAGLPFSVRCHEEKIRAKLEELRKKKEATKKKERNACPAKSRDPLLT